MGIKKIKRNQFLKNVLILVTGTAGAQMITILFSPIITRLYGPEAFGIMGTFLALTNIITPIAALSYPVAIVLPKEEYKSKVIIKSSFLVAMMMSIISLIVILMFNNQIITLFNIEEITVYLYFIPLIILFATAMQVMEQWLIRTKQFVINAKVTFTQSLIINIGKVGLGLFWPIAQVLVIFTLISSGLKALLMFIFSKKRPNALKNKSIDLKQMKDSMREYKDFPFYRAPEMFLNSISTGLPLILLTTFFSPIVAGFYSIVRTVLSLPTQLLGKAIGDVFYPRVTEAANNNENVTKLIRKSTIYLGLIGIIPFGLIILFGPQLFSFVFGEEWVTSGEYARWIALWSYVAFMNRPSVMALPVLKAQRFHLIYTIIMLMVRLVLLALGFYIYNSDKIAIALYGVSGAILNFGLILYTLRISEKTNRST